jgi:hypothetical protein
MPYEVSCPSCQVRLVIRDDTVGSSFICPRCLKPVPHPGSAGEAPTAGAASIHTGPPRWKPRVPTVESEAKTSTWAAYFVIVALVVLAMVGIVVQEVMAGPLQRGDVAAEFRAPCCCVSLLMVSLPVLIVYPIIRPRSSATARKSASWTPTRNLTILGLLILSPIAFYILLGIVCSSL